MLNTPNVIILVWELTANTVHTLLVSLHLLANSLTHNFNSSLKINSQIV